MKHCNNCYVEVDQEVIVCPYCGSPTPKHPILSMEQPSVSYALLGFFVPIIGFILWLLWKEEFPLKAQSSIKGAVYGVGVAFVSIVVYIIYMLLLLWLFPQ